MTYHSGKPSQPCAWSAQIHGPVRPLEQPGIFARIRTMLADEADVARALGHKPQPSLWVGVAIGFAIACVWAGWLVFGG